MSLLGGAAAGVATRSPCAAADSKATSRFSQQRVTHWITSRNIPIKAERGTASGRALIEGQVVHIADVRADPEYTLVEAPRLGDFRTILCVPMLREGVPIGVLTLTRSEVQPFIDKSLLRVKADVTRTVLE